MFRRSLLLVFVVVAASALVARSAIAEDKAHDGTVVSAGAGKLTMTFKGDEKKHTHDVAKNATITVDGKAAKLEDLKAGFHVKIEDKK